MKIVNKTVYLTQLINIMSYSQVKLAEIVKCYFLIKKTFGIYTFVRQLSTLKYIDLDQFKFYFTPAFFENLME